MNINRLGRFFALVAMTSVLFCGVGFAVEDEQSIAIAIANYLVAGRTVLAKNQSLINDPSRGDKGFTPEAYDKQATSAFLERVGNARLTLSVSDNPFNKALSAAHQSAKEVIEEAQKQINEPGKGFKGFHPAVFGARVGEKLFRRSGIRLKQTSLKYRMGYNKPDEFEVSVLKRFEKSKKGTPYFEKTTLGELRGAISVTVPVTEK